MIYAFAAIFCPYANIANYILCMCSNLVDIFQGIITHAIGAQLEVNNVIACRRVHRVLQYCARLRECWYIFPVSRNPIVIGGADALQFQSIGSNLSSKFSRLPLPVPVGILWVFPPPTSTSTGKSKNENLCPGCRENKLFHANGTVEIRWGNTAVEAMCVGFCLYLWSPSTFWVTL